MLQPFLNVIGWSVVLAIISYPVHQWLVRKTGRVALSALITSVLIVLAAVVPLLLLGGIAVAELVTLGHSVSGGLHTPDRLLSHAAVTASAWAAAHLGLDQTAISAWIQQRIAEAQRGAGQYTLSFAAGVLEAVVSSLFVIIAMFLLLRDGDGLVSAIPDLLPFERTRSEALLVRIKDAVQASIYGVVVIAVVQGVLCGVMFWLLGIPSAALWGMLTMFASVLPVVGAFAVWGPGTIYLAMNGEWPQAAALAIWGTFVVSGIDNVLRPRLVAGRVGLSELAMFFALLGGLQVFGGLGLVLGPVAFATADSLIDALRQHKAEDALATGVRPGNRWGPSSG
jgi:predicted PurR-regulated permease PerM